MSMTPLWILLFLGITFGLFSALIGATLFFATRDKKAAATVLVVGLIFLIGTIVLYIFS